MVNLSSVLKLITNAAQVNRRAPHPFNQHMNHYRHHHRPAAVSVIALREVFKLADVEMQVKLHNTATHDQSDA